MKMKAFKEIAKLGGADMLKTKYADYVVDTETGYDVTIKLHYPTQVTNGKEDKVFMLFAMLRRNVIAAPFQVYFEKVKDPKAKVTPVAVRYREHESWYLVPAGEGKLSVIYSIYFSDADDSVFAKVFAQEFQDAK